jgi:hypothetical protein
MSSPGTTRYFSIGQLDMSSAGLAVGGEQEAFSVELQFPYSAAFAMADGFGICCEGEMFTARSKVQLVNCG